MVMFHEDEKRMKEQERAEKLARRGPVERWIRRIVKIVLIGAVLVWIGLTFLTALGGDHPALKAGIVDYLQQASGREARIDEFRSMKFYPNLKLDVGDLALLNKDSRQPAIHVKDLKFSAGFFDMMFSRGIFRELAVENFQAEPGIAGPHDVAIDFMGLKEDAFETAPGLIIEGRYGDEKLTARLMLEKLEAKAGGTPRYKVPKTAPFEAAIGDKTITGQIGSAKDGGMEIQIKSFAVPEGTLSGTLNLTRALSGMEAKADLTFADSKANADLTVTKEKTEGDVTFPQLKDDDLKILAAACDTLTRLPFAGKLVSPAYKTQVEFKTDTKTVKMDEQTPHPCAAIRKLEGEEQP